jgi:hypothetical protein
MGYTSPMPITMRKLPYRDIRSDLKERLRTAVSERDILAAKAASLDEEVDLLTKLLDQEERRFGDQEKSSNTDTKPEDSLGNFIIEQVKIRPMTKVDLLYAAKAAGYFADGGGPRSIHATVINMLKSGKLVVAAHGRFAPS